MVSTADITRVGELTMASNFRRSSSPELRCMTCRSKEHASEYACMAPSRFCALSRRTAVFAFWRALESMAFCEGCFELRRGKLPLADCERCREWPRELDRPSSSSVYWRRLAEVSVEKDDCGTGDGAKPADLDVDDERRSAKSLGSKE